eukprot:4262710-Prymnesium_polylepis.1
MPSPRCRRSTTLGSSSTIVTRPSRASANAARAGWSRGFHQPGSDGQCAAAKCAGGSESDGTSYGWPTARCECDA